MASIFARLPANSGIAPGEALNATVDIPAQANGLTIPYGALLDDAGQPYVFVVAKGVAHRRDVTIGAANGDRVTVLKGLKPGEQLVVEGGTAVEDGMKVRTR
jgi:multidrug efflux pump subunit AcrA (membrane-fusion protein)